LLDPVDRDRIKIGLDTDGPYYDKSGNPLSWEMHNFYHTILAANVTILNKIINEVQNAEYDIINLFSQPLMPIVINSMPLRQR
jgi:hypothetical protein